LSVDNEPLSVDNEPLSVDNTPLSLDNAPLSSAIFLSGLPPERPCSWGSWGLWLFLIRSWLSLIRSWLSEGLASRVPPCYTAPREHIFHN
jgi:hypothetical protein